MFNVYSDKQREQKKKEMLEKCFELFVEKGLENTSLNDLSKHCKTYKAALYNYFESKDFIVATYMAEDWKICLDKIQNNIISG